MCNQHTLTEASWLHTFFLKERTRLLAEDARGLFFYQQFYCFSGLSSGNGSLAGREGTPTVEFGKW